MLESFVVVLSHTIAALLLSWISFRRYPITRPPIGVFNLWDVAIMIGGIVLVPYLYLALPRWIVAGLLAIGVVSALYFAWEPVLRFRWAVWLITVALAAYDVGAALLGGAPSVAFFAINNVVLTLVIVGLTNLWAQSGMKACDVAILVGLLAIYDVIATWQLPLTSDLFRRLVDLPFAPLVAWPVSRSDLWLGIGLGDVLLATVFPLVARKAFGCGAGRAALAISLGSIAVLLALPLLGIVQVTFPVMLVLGPLMVVQYVYWRRRGAERMTWAYLLAEPTHIQATASV